MSIYNYTISQDTANGQVAPEKLTNEINSSAITIGLTGVTVDLDDLIIEFKISISPAEETILTQIVANHDGVPAVNGIQKFSIVDANGNSAAIVDDNGTPRLALDLSDTITGPQGPQGLQGDQGTSGYGVYALAVVTGAGVSQNSLGLTVNRTGVGQYEYTFLDPTTDANYAVVGNTTDLTNNTDTNVFIQNKTTTNFSVTIGVGDNGQGPDVLSDEDHNIVVLGPQGPGALTNVYDIWLANGNVGTETDFLNSLIGPQGTQGIQGIQGPVGDIGPTGPQGPQGIQGPTGNDGADGAEWLVGTGVPPASIGNNGDFYLNSVDGSVFSKISGGWFFVANIKGPQGDQGLQGPQGPVGPVGPPTAFGNFYNYVEELAERSTVSTSPVNVVDLNVLSLPAGDYRINWSYSWSGQTNQDFRAEIVQDGTTQIFFHSQEAKDSNTDNQNITSKFKKISLSGNHSFSLNFWSEGGSTMWIRDVNIELWRIN